MHTISSVESLVHIGNSFNHSLKLQLTYTIRNIKYENVVLNNHAILYTIVIYIIHSTDILCIPSICLFVAEKATLISSSEIRFEKLTVSYSKIIEYLQQLEKALNIYVIYIAG